ncbi:MAG: hypothetical protein ACYSUB_01890 [Planctomycetota bacterium]|jgi:hypothetical protein
MDNPFIVGDPVQASRLPNLLGKVVKVTEKQWPSNGTVALVFVKLIGRGTEVIFYPHELRVCKCAARIPKGVSQYQN